MPKFNHDCTSCKFLAHFDGHDLYVCVSTIVARFGNDGWDYTSGYPSNLPILKVGAAMAEVKGILPA